MADAARSLAKIAAVRRSVRDGFFFFFFLLLARLRTSVLLRNARGAVPPLRPPAHRDRFGRGRSRGAGPSDRADRAALRAGRLRDREVARCQGCDRDDASGGPESRTDAANAVGLAVRQRRRKGYAAGDQVAAGSAERLDDSANGAAGGARGRPSRTIDQRVHGVDARRGGCIALTTCALDAKGSPYRIGGAKRFAPPFPFAVASSSGGEPPCNVCASCLF